MQVTLRQIVVLHDAGGPPAVVADLIDALYQDFDDAGRAEERHLLKVVAPGGDGTTPDLARLSGAILYIVCLDRFEPDAPSLSDAALRARNGWGVAALERDVDRPDCAISRRHRREERPLSRYDAAGLSSELRPELDRHAVSVPAELVNVELSKLIEAAAQFGWSPPDGEVLKGPIAAATARKARRWTDQNRPLAWTLREDALAYMIARGQVELSAFGKLLGGLDWDHLRTRAAGWILTEGFSQAEFWGRARQVLAFADPEAPVALVLSDGFDAEEGAALLRPLLSCAVFRLQDRIAHHREPDDLFPDTRASSTDTVPAAADETLAPVDAVRVRLIDADSRAALADAMTREAHLDERMRADIVLLARGPWGASDAEPPAGIPPEAGFAAVLDSQELRPDTAGTDRATYLGRLAAAIADATDRVDAADPHSRLSGE